MKKFSILFIFCSLLAIAYLSFPLHKPAHFVALKKGHFSLDGAAFYPITLNYMAALQSDGKNMWPCEYPAYNKGSRNLYTTKDSCLMQLKSDMDLIKEMGFNSIRIVGIGEESVNKKTGQLSVSARIGNTGNKEFDISGKTGYEQYFNALEELFKLAGDAGLKIIFLTKMSGDVRATEDHLRRLATRFRDHPEIMAYDFFNEPLYFDSLQRTKEQVHGIVKRWGTTVRAYAPHQLSTIGLAGIREVFQWDPNILDVDFVSLHPYEYEPDQVRNEIYWYGKNIKTPWIIGETAIPADSDSITYEAQRLFARKTLKQTLDCNGQGYSWWQYKDVEWYSYHANFMGVVSLNGETHTKTPNALPVYGTVKSMAQEIKHFDPEKGKEEPVQLGNYYNYSANKQFRITGILTDSNGRPIKDGVILAWNEWWSNSFHTVSKEDGSFELLSSFPFYHWMASATEYSMIRGNISPDTAQTSGNPMPTIRLGIRKLEALSF